MASSSAQEAARVLGQDQHPYKDEAENDGRHEADMFDSPTLTPPRSKGRKTIVAIAATLLTFLLLSIYASTSPTSGIKALHAPWTKPRKGLVISGYSALNTTWLEDIPSDWEIYMYNSDDPSAGRPLPRNSGREAMAYTTFMIEEYDNLPDYIVFIHGHYRSWHQPEPIQYKINALNLAAVDKYKFVPLRCTNFGHCTGPAYWNHMSGDHEFLVIARAMHDFVYRKEDPWYEPLPDEIAAACCAQFAITKEQAMSKPRAFWERVRAPFLRDMLVDFPDWHAPDFKDTEKWFEYQVGGTMEIWWHWLFGMPPVTCYEEDLCREVFFQDRIHCDGKTTSIAASKALVDAGNITCTYDDRGL